MRGWDEKFFIDQREPEVSRRNNVTAFEISFIITDSDPSRSTPCSEPSDAAEIISRRHTQCPCCREILKIGVEFFPAGAAAHLVHRSPEPLARHDRRAAARMFHRKRNCVYARPARHSRIWQLRQAWRRRPRPREKIS